MIATQRRRKQDTVAHLTSEIRALCPFLSPAKCAAYAVQFAERAQRPPSWNRGFFWATVAALFAWVVAVWVVVKVGGP